MSDEKRLTQYRRQRSQGNGISQIAVALIALAGIGGLLLVLWQLADVFAALGDQLAYFDVGAR